MFVLFVYLSLTVSLSGSIVAHVKGFHEVYNQQPLVEMSGEIPIQRVCHDCGNTHERFVSAYHYDPFDRPLCDECTAAARGVSTVGAEVQMVVNTSDTSEGASHDTCAVAMADGVAEAPSPQRAADDPLDGAAVATTPRLAANDPLMSDADVVICLVEGQSACLAVLPDWGLPDWGIAGLAGLPDWGLPDWNEPVRADPPHGRSVRTVRTDRPCGPSGFPGGV